MIPFFRSSESYSIGIGSRVTYGYLECGHTALSFKLTVLVWVLDFGVEFK